MSTGFLGPCNMSGIEAFTLNYHKDVSALSVPGYTGPLRPGLWSLSISTSYSGTDFCADGFPGDLIGWVDLWTTLPSHDGPFDDTLVAGVIAGFPFGLLREDFTTVCCENYFGWMADLPAYWPPPEGYTGPTDCTTPPWETTFPGTMCTCPRGTFSYDFRLNFRPGALFVLDLQIDGTWLHS